MRTPRAARASESSTYLSISCAAMIHSLLSPRCQPRPARAIARPARMHARRPRKHAAIDCGACKCAQAATQKLRRRLREGALRGARRRSLVVLLAGAAPERARWVADRLQARQTHDVAVARAQHRHQPARQRGVHGLLAPEDLRGRVHLQIALGTKAEERKI